MNDSTRRIFIGRAIVCGSAVLLVPMGARAAARASEDDETAVALGYKHDTLQVDKKRFPRHDAQQRCSSCSFFQGAASDEWGGCAMFGRKHIAAAGWCNAWAKKPG
jgi:hypothetical protein